MIDHLKLHVRDIEQGRAFLRDGAPRAKPVVGNDVEAGRHIAGAA